MVRLRVGIEVDVDASDIMTLRIWREPQKLRTTDAELGARLSRLRSEVAQARAAGVEVDSVHGALDEVESRLKEAEKLEQTAPNESSQASDLKEECLRIAQEVEADLCMVKPAELLYPTWVRLRENLYRFDKPRGDAWEADIEMRIPDDVEGNDPNKLRSLRQRLRQLTLELREAALRFNRLNEERAAVTREVIDLGVVLVSVFAVLVLVCLTLSSSGISDVALTFLSLVAGISGGGMGAVFSRFGTPRDERMRQRFRRILKSDLCLHVSVGSGAALVVAAVLLSERIFALPDSRLAQVAYLTVFGFGAGFSDRVWKVMLSQVIGPRGRRSSRSGE